MKWLKVFFIIVLVVSFMPLDAFCDDHHDSTEHHHGIVLCHTSCHGAVLANSSSIDLPEITSSIYSIQKFTYEGPSLATEERPPILPS